MSNRNKYLGLSILFITILSLAFLQAYQKYPGTAQEQDGPKWLTYANNELGISLSYPPSWKVMEVPNQAYQSSIPQIWLSGSDFPPPNTGARPDVLLMFLEQDPSADWDSQFFEDYQSEAVVLDGKTATRVSGYNKEGQMHETAYILPLGDSYLLALAGQSQDASAYFDQVASTIRLPDPP